MRKVIKVATGLLTGALAFLGSCRCFVGVGPGVSGKDELRRGAGSASAA